MQITFERSGGLIGRKVSLSIDMNDLPAEESENLRQLLVDANFFALVSDPPPDSLLADGFTYAITVTTDTLIHTVRATEMSASPSLRALIQNLSLRARTQRKPA